MSSNTVPKTQDPQKSGPPVPAKSNVDLDKLLGEAGFFAKGTTRQETSKPVETEVPSVFDTLVKGISNIFSTPIKGSDFSQGMARVGKKETPQAELFDALLEVQRRKERNELTPTEALFQGFGVDLRGETEEQLKKQLNRRAETQQKITESVSTALDIQRAQEKHNLEVELYGQDGKQAAELHQFDLAQAVAKTQGLALKNQQAEQKIEMENAKAVQAGLVLPSKDPVIKQEEYLQMWKDRDRKGNSSLQNSLLDAFDQKMSEKAKQEGNLSPEQRDMEWMRGALVDAMKKMGSEKHLAYTPMGKEGALLGGLLDIASLGLGLGTTVFGGKMTQSEQAQILMRGMASISPVVRTEMNDLLQRDKMEQTAEMRLAKIGMSNMRPYTTSNNGPGADEIYSTVIDIQDTLANSEYTKDDFGTDSVTDIGSAFNSYDSLQILLKEYQEESDPERLKVLYEQIAVAEAAMREPLEKFVESGGDFESLTAKIRTAQDVLVSKKGKYGAELTFGPGDDPKRVQFQAMQKATANTVANKLEAFRLAAASILPSKEGLTTGKNDSMQKIRAQIATQPGRIPNSTESGNEYTRRLLEMTKGKK